MDAIARGACRRLLLALLVGWLALGAAGNAVPVAAGDPALSASPNPVPFDPTPGKAGTTTLNIAVGNTVPLFLCVSDNGAKPVVVAGFTTPNVTAALDFPIQAGRYTFTLRTDPTCDSGLLLLPPATPGGPARPVQVVVDRAGPNGVVGGDDLALMPPGPVTLAPDTSFPMSTSVCIMSGDGAQKGVAVTIRGTTVAPVISDQNGCHKIDFIVSGSYTFSLYPGVPAPMKTLDSCSGANKPNATANPQCAQVALRNSGGGLGGATLEGASRVPAGAQITGAAVVGNTGHGIEVCVAVVQPTGATTGTVVVNSVNAYNASGAVNLTPLGLSYPTGTAILVTTYDVTVGGQQPCPGVTFTVAGGQVTALTALATANMTLLDRRYFVMQ